MGLDLSNAVWHKSTRSGMNGCVEVAFIDGGRVAFRDSKDRQGPGLVFSPVDWQAFVVGGRDREFEQIRKGERRVAA